MFFSKITNEIVCDYNVTTMTCNYNDANHVVTVIEIEAETSLRKCFVFYLLLALQKNNLMIG